jgi:hypothetical protein
MCKYKYLRPKKIPKIKNLIPKIKKSICFISILQQIETFHNKMVIKSVIIYNFHFH